MTKETSIAIDRDCLESAVSLLRFYDDMLGQNFGTNWLVRRQLIKRGESILEDSNAK